MTEQHPITPPPELVLQWANALSMYSDREVFTTIAQWGADQELDACCEWFVRDWTDVWTADKLRATRRPKPPSLGSLKRVAMLQLEAMEENGYDLRQIRRALEQLDD